MILPINRLYSHPQSTADHAGLGNILDQWEQEATSRENRAEAKYRILNFYQIEKKDSLDLKNLHLESLPDIFDFPIFKNNLEKLNLSHNLFRALPSSIGNLSALTSLDLSKNQLTELPDSIGNLPALTKLKLSGNRLIELPLSIGNLSALTSLDLSWNYLTELPDSIGNLSALTKLELSRNHLTELPDSIGALSALTKLQLSRNQLTELPRSIGALSALTKLGLSGNQLTELPDSIGNLSDLTSLDLSWNDLTGLPLEITNLGSSCVIELTGCPLPQNVLETLRDTIRSLNYTVPRTSHSIYDNQGMPWKTVREYTAALYHKLNQSPRELSSLSESFALQSWLNRLSMMVDYHKEALLHKIVAFLEKADQDEKFREVFAMTIEGASETCGDKMALSVLHLGLNYTLATFDLKEMQKLADFLKKGVWTINILEEVAREKISRFPDYDKIEVYLGYPIELKRDLAIPIDVEEMKHFTFSGLTHEDIQTAKKLVLSRHNDQQAYLDFLVKNETWRHALALNYPREFENAENLKTEACLKDNLEPEDYLEIEQHFYDKLKELSKRALVAQKPTTV